MKEITLLLNGISKPLMIGLYDNDVLLKQMKSEDKLSEALPVMLDEILKQYKLSRLVYANGPGSYMGIKISYLSLKTLSIVFDIPLFAISAFDLNKNAPIKANKDLSFVMENGKISLQKLPCGEFFLPADLKALNLKEDNLPFYFLDAV